MGIFKYYIFPAIAAITIAALVFNEYRTDKEHHAFFEDVRSFIDAGGRNTADDGFTLCSTLNDLILFTDAVNVPLVDCDKYFRDRSTRIFRHIEEHHMNDHQDEDAILEHLENEHITGHEEK